MDHLTRFLLPVAIGLAVSVPLSADPAPSSPSEDFSLLRGANYVPSYARNDVQIWMDYDSETIDRELGYAARLKLNSVRIFLQYAVYEHDPRKFLDNFEDFLRLCEKHGIQAMPVVFDSCFGEYPDLETYRRNDWVANPGQHRLGRRWWAALEQYCREVVGGHRDDKRIVIWDVMNEPMITSHARNEEGREKIWTFLDHFLDVVGQLDPTHPRTVGFSNSQYLTRVVDKTEVLAFHNYTGDMDALRVDIRRVKALGREHGKPVLINEIARRNTGQDFWRFMPVVEEEKIGWYFWELMLGNTQFSRGDEPIQGVVYPDGTCRDAREIASILHPNGADRPAREVAVAAGFKQRGRRWTRDEAWDWYKQQPWLCGFNFVPSTARNTTEFWQSDTFDVATIGRELSWAAGLGFNTCRVFLQFLVWKHDPAGLKQRMDRFLEIADKHGVSTMFVLFDDCTFGDPRQTEPYLGEQREPISGMILPSWTPSPGLAAVTDRQVWPDLQKYVQDIVGSFGQDPRVLAWDLYNEPGNSGMGNESLPLVEAAFGWARQVESRQPLTIAVWNSGLGDINRQVLTLSDIVSYHAYTDLAGQRTAITGYKAHGRPVVCTEWMARTLGSRFESELPLFKQEAVGCYSWGLVNGRTQCQFGWSSKKGSPEPEIWFHDIFRNDGSPYRPSEVEAIRRIVGKKKSRADGRLMMFADSSRGRPFAKDPDVVRFRGKYFMYYSMGPDKDGHWAIGIAESDDLTTWTKIGEILPKESYERNGLVAGAAIVLDDKVHLFYSTYGNGPQDAICHAWSDDGIHFQRAPTNPIFRPTGDWNLGRAIDSDVIEHKGKLFLYCATRDPSGKIQMLVGAAAPKNSDFGRAAWTQLSDGSMLNPELPWEKTCIEAPSICKRGGRLFMFYGGAYNNAPQQIGVAVSDDGLVWERLSRFPLLPNGRTGEWNSSESGHPGVFVDDDGETYLFFQGNADRGKTWYLSKMSVAWDEDEPYLIRYCDGRQFRLRPPGEIRDTDAAVDYSDGWTLWHGNDPRHGTLHYANQAGCTAELSFDGTELWLIHKVGPDCGIAEIEIDGQAVAVSQLDTYSAHVDWNRCTVLAKNLVAGEHVATIRVSGRGHTESSNSYVQIVGFLVE